jgi:Planctomycete cytochrome C/WD domain, G-beta repeat
MSRSHLCLWTVCALPGPALLLLLHLAPRQTEVVSQTPATAKQPLSFINDVAPILKENCFACHDAKNKKGKLDMTTFENLRKGGSHDDPIEAGKPEESVLVDLLERLESGRMPPKDAGPALPKAKIEVIKQWIKEGARLDGAIDSKADLFRELRIRWQPPPPPVAYTFSVPITALAFTPDNQSLVVGGHHELTIWDISTEKLIKRIRTRAERAYALAFVPDGKLIEAGGRPGQEGDVRVYNLDANTAKTADGVTLLDGVHDKSVFVAQLLDCDDSVLALALSDDGKHLAAAGCDRLVRVWDISAGTTAPRLEHTIANHADWVCGLAFSHDGKYLLTGGRDNAAKIWDLVAGASVATFLGHQNVVYGVSLSLDGTQAMSVGEDGAFRFWQTTDKDKKVAGSQIKIGKGGHAKAVFRLVVTGDAQKPLAATCSADGTVKLWDLAKGAVTKTLAGLSDYAFAVAISPDGTMVAAGSWSGEVAVWKIDDGLLLKRFHASPGFAAK